jgi:hypothetical protein
VSENKKDPRALRVLLLVCAGLLFIIVFTIASEVYSASQAANTSGRNIDTCSVVAKYTTYVPVGCEKQPELELR